jgi:hypothetical protein
MRDPYSFEIIEIFHQYGYSFKRISAGQRGGVYIRNRKFLSKFPPHRLNFKLIEPDLSIHNVKSFLLFLRCCLQFISLYKNPEAPRFDWAIVRDKDKKKISFFDFKAKLKTVIWHNPQDFENELKNIRHFQDRGVPCLPFKMVNPSAKSAVQDLKGRPVVAKHFNSTKILGSLQSYVTKESVLKPLEIRFNEDLIRERAVSEALRQAENVISRLKNGANALFPYCIVHGDLTLNNILLYDQAYFLIDFERCFEASAYYDFIYLWLNSNVLRQEEAMQIVTSINQKYDHSDLSAKEGLKLALALFVYDNLNYIGQYCSNAAPRLFSETQIHKADRALAQIL